MKLQTLLLFLMTFGVLLSALIQSPSEAEARKRKKKKKTKKKTGNGGSSGGSGGGGNLPVGLTGAQKVDILFQFNRARRTVSPTASGMIELVWDDGIAAEAQDYVNHCDWDYGYPQFTNGINLYRDQAQDPVDVAQIRGYDQGQNYDYATDGCTGGPCQTMHIYKLIVTANATRVGCGMKKCGGPKLYWHTCGIGFDSNAYDKDAKPWVSGTPCSACPAGYPYCHSNKLCSATA
jgi:hypothetical protein